jgi:AcrR family transcriptional regulator
MQQPMVKEKAKKTKIIVKVPTQERSRQTVSTILDACARLLVSEGFYSITTDKIAKEAGVSIGSLYQFFGNKESVVQALVTKIIEEDKHTLREQTRALSALPQEQRIRGMVEIAINLRKQNAELRAKLSTIQYYVTDAAFVSDSIRFFQDVVKYNLPQTPGRDLEKVSYIIVNAFLGMMNTMAIDRPDFIHDQSLIDEVTSLIYKYLDIAASPSAGQKKGDFI